MLNFKKKEEKTETELKAKKSVRNRKKVLIMCRTGMGSSMILKIKTMEVAKECGFDLDVTHDAFSGFAGQSDTDIIITMEDLVPEFDGSKAFVIGISDIMDKDYLKCQLERYFAEHQD